jgi:predicted NAD-dependent protein-ADP-ribosyltransferase YbiA (DUF1768 family)
MSIEIFNPRDLPYGNLSNNAYFPMTIDDQRWNNVTYYIYSNMLNDFTYRHELKKENNANMSYKYKQLKQKEQDDIIKKSLYESIVVKSTNQEYVNKLYETGDKEIIYKSDNAVLGSGKDNKGLNLLGKYMMELRDVLKQKVAIQNDERVYERYLVFNLLEGEMMSGVNIGDKYKDVKTASDIIKIYGVNRVQKSDAIREYVKERFKKEPELKEILEQDNIENIFNYIYKKRLREFKADRIFKIKNIIFRAYCDTILQNSYHHIPVNQYTPVIFKELNRIPISEYDNLKNVLYDLYEKNLLPSEVLTKVKENVIFKEQLPKEEDIKAYENITFKKVEDEKIKTTEQFIFDASNEYFSPSRYTGMLKIDGKNYPTMSHYIITCLYAALEKADLCSIFIDVPWIDNLRGDTIVKGTYISVLNENEFENILPYIDPDDKKEFDTSSFIIEEVSGETIKNVNLEDITLIKRAQGVFRNGDEIEFLEDGEWKFGKIYNDRAFIAGPGKFQMEEKLYDIIYDDKQIKLKVKKELIRAPPGGGKLSTIIDSQDQVTFTKDGVKMTGEILYRDPKNGKYAITYGRKVVKDSDIRQKLPWYRINDRFIKEVLCGKNSFRNYQTKDVFTCYNKYGAEYKIRIGYDTNLGFYLQDKWLFDSQLDYVSQYKNQNKMNDAYNFILKDINGSKGEQNVFIDVDELVKLYDKEYDEYVKNRLIKFAIKGLNKKFVSRPMQDLLLFTEDKNLIWNDKNDSILGVGYDGKGFNFVGKYLMTIRTENSKNRQNDATYYVDTNNINDFALHDLFINSWIDARAKDILNVIVLVRKYLVEKNIKPIVFEANFATDVINIIYQPCNGMFEKIKTLNVKTPDYFIKKMLRYDVLNTLLDKDKVIDVIWKNIIVIIYFLNEHLKSFDAVKKVLRNSQNIISEKRKCKNIKTEGVNVFSDSNFDDCIFGAMQNLLNRISGLSEKYLGVQKLDSSEINLSVSIILNSNKYLGEIEEKEIAVEEEPAKKQESLFEDSINENEKTINVEGERGEDIEVSYADILDEDDEDDKEQDYPSDDEDEYNENEDDSGDVYDGSRGYDDPNRPNPRLLQEYDPEFNWRLDDNIEYTPPGSPEYDPEFNWQMNDLPGYTPPQSPTYVTASPTYAPIYEQSPTYNPPASPGYNPPASRGYTPPASPGYNPPASPGYNPPASPMTNAVRKTDFSEFLNDPKMRMHIYLLNSYPGLEFETSEKLSIYILSMVKYVNDYKMPKRVKINRINFFN